MRLSPLSFMAAASLALSVGSANAAILTQTYSVVGTNFISTATPPYSTITETFTVVFDTTKLVAQQTTGISLDPSSTVKPASTLGYAYNPGTGRLTVGGIDASVGASSSTSVDFAVTIQNAAGTTFSPLALSYSDSAGNIYSTTPQNITLTELPEPTSLALFGGALAVFGFMRRRHKQ